MELYILKSAACLALFFAFYKLFLENTSIHNFKRFYLFGSLLASFLIPLITFKTYAEASPFIATYTAAAQQQIFIETKASVNYWPFVLWTVYGLGVLFFSLKFFKNLFSLIQKIRENPKYRNSSFINILLNENVIPHTFFSYIFLNKKQYENHEIPAEVMLHEETHARQKHSLDIVLVEVLQIVFWFNPLFYFLKRSIKLNHEFLADRAVLNAGAETSDYQKILLAFSSNVITPTLAHSLNYSSIKKRFTVMKTHTSKRAIWFRSLLLLPLLSLLIYGFSTKEVVERELTKKEVQSKIVQQKATNAEIDEYNKLAKKYNIVNIEKRIIKKNDLERLEIIYNKMTDDQKVNAEPFPKNIPPPPPAPKVMKGEKSDIPPPPIPPTPPKSSSPVKTNIDQNKPLDKAVYYYNDMVIAPEKANDLLKKNDKLRIYITKTENGNGTVTLSETPISETTKASSAANGNLYMAAEAPSAPNANKLEYVKELAKRGAIFYIGPDKYTSEEAIELVKKSTNDVTIDVSKYPIVQLGGC
ncbi:M56 family metallopeptidase [Aequorivita lipolytica]|uniref:M56 family metallopeptidase n=1 Tax=Aequorivita lipolytica TaxID=153267 RepID=A0A5C6YTG7_9FLAO|nr:M56 family metallopeptidase [Aequorivita lipolytica]TXD70748.1 M56 family metallopeptidase [Aequorivita lipolytica]SRX49791.1 hypothetical protein AEQU2_00255 [Aequorivita lipolytica]